MGDKDLKVTDKRMFSADGELREEYRHLDKSAEKATQAPPPEPPEAPAGESPAESGPAARQEPDRAAAPEPESEPGPSAEPAARRGAPETGEAAEPREAPEPGAPDSRAGQPADAAGWGAGEPAGDSPRLEIPGTPEGLGAPTFLDLVSLLAEPVALYLGDVELPDGKSAENLDMARLHIDLLDVLRQKTAGNLELGESRLLEDLLYRCRVRYVQKRG